MVYLDTVIVQNGQSFFDGFPAEIVAARRQAARRAVGGASGSAASKQRARCAGFLCGSDG